MRVQRRKPSFQLEESMEASHRQKYQGQGRLQRKEEHRAPGGIKLSVSITGPGCSEKMRLGERRKTGKGVVNKRNLRDVK